jgi:hypothetical protein
MRTQIPVAETCELYIAALDNHFLIENNAGGVVVHASRDNVSERRKAALIRYFATEGYIPDRYEWFSEPQAEGFFGVRWVVDNSWSENDPQIERRARRREIGVTLLLVAVVLLLRWWTSPPGF